MRTRLPRDKLLWLLAALLTTPVAGIALALEPVTHGTGFLLGGTLLMGNALFAAYHLGTRYRRPPPEKAEAPPCPPALSEREFRTLAENSPDHIARYDHRCRISYVNTRLEASVGRSAWELLGRTPTEVFPGQDDAARFEAGIAAVFRTGEAGEMEITHLDCHSGPRHHHVRLVPEADGTGEIVSVLTIGRDFTERRRREENLRKREEESRALAENSPAPIFRYDRQCRRIYVNPAVERISGLPAATLLGRHPSDRPLISAKQTRQITRLIEHVFATGEIAEHELEYTAKDGRIYHFRNRHIPEYGCDGEIRSVLSVSSDITALKEALRIARVGTWELDLATHRLTWSEEVYHLIEIDRQSSGAAYSTFLALVHPEDRQRLEQAYADAVHRSPPYDIEHRLLMPDGRIKHVHQRGKTFYAADGTPLRSIGTIQDVTEARESARRLEKSRALLQDLTAHREEVREEERRRIARDLHEELGQLLTSLRMGISMLRVQFGPEHAAVLQKLPPLLALVDKSIEGLRHTVADLRPTPLDTGIVPALEWLARDFSKHTGIECIFVGEDDIELPDDRATPLFRIAQEALTNVARHADASRVDLLLKRRDDCLWLEIRDDGCGFDPQASRPKSFGLLGMWERALMLGGELDIRSTADSGAEIILRFPG